MSGFPASVFTAVPVDSGFSDYYGSCVALPAGCGFRQSPVAYIKHELSAFSVKGFSHVTFAISLYLEALHPEYHTLVPIHMTSARMTYVSVPFVCRRTISPSFGCQSSSLAFVLIRRFSSPYRPGFRNLLTDLYPPLSAATTGSRSKLTLTTAEGDWISAADAVSMQRALTANVEIRDDIS